MNHVPDIAETDRIAGLANPVLRNLQITQCYHELSLAVARKTGASANWCTFATWASKQAGQSIRKEDFAQALESLLTTAPATVQAATDVAAVARQMGARTDTTQILQRVWQAIDPGAAIERTSAAIARGNQKVFAEIGREFARFAAACLNDTRFEASHIEAFCAELRPGDPPDGQRYLRQAFRRYYHALFESEPKARAELLLLANLEIGFHEQTRLQPEIAEALEAALVGPRELAQRLIVAVFPYGGIAVYGLVLLRRLLGRPTLLELAIERLVAVVRQQVRGLVTEHMLAICFPGEVQLRLGDDLRARFPPALQQLANPDLLALLCQIDPTPDSVRESGALDWGDLPDRIHFIADLFRCYGLAPNLLEPPFSPRQVEALKSGRLPEGPL